MPHRARGCDTAGCGPVSRRRARLGQLQGLWRLRGAQAAARRAWERRRRPLRAGRAGASVATAMQRRSCRSGSARAWPASLRCQRVRIMRLSLQCTVVSKVPRSLRACKLALWLDNKGGRMQAVAQAFELVVKSWWVAFGQVARRQRCPPRSAHDTSHPLTGTALIAIEVKASGPYRDLHPDPAGWADPGARLLREWALRPGLGARVAIINALYAGGGPVQRMLPLLIAESLRRDRCAPRWAACTGA